MLPCIWSVTDHRWCQNVVRTKTWHTRCSQVCHWCSYHILASSVIYYWTDTWQHGIYLFYIITKSLFYFKLFQHNAKTGFLPHLCPLWRRQKKPFDVIYYLYKMKQFHFHSKELWLVEKNHATVTHRLSNLMRVCYLNILKTLYHF